MRSLCLVVAWSRVVFRSLVIGRRSIGGSVILRGRSVIFSFGGVVRRRLCVVARGSIGRCVILGCLSGVARRRVILGSLGVVGRSIRGVVGGCFGVVCWSSISCGVVLRRLGGVILRGFGVVAWSSIRCGVVLRSFGGVVLRSLCLVVAWCRVIFRSLSCVVVGRSSIGGSVVFGLLGVVPGGFSVVAGCSVCCGVINWSLGEVCWFNVIRRSSCGVVSRGCVILGRLSCSCVARGSVILWRIGVVGRSSISCGIILRSLGGVVLRSLRLVVAWSRVVFIGVS